jgi:hypothetical protein
MEQVHEGERVLHEAKQKLEQAQIDAQYEIAAFEAAKEREVAQIENRQSHEVELLAIQLQEVQAETEKMRERHQQRMSELGELQRTRADAIEHEFESQKTKLENANNELIAQKEKRISELMASIRDCEAEMKGCGALPEDTDHIARLEEIVSERREAIEQLTNEYRMYEKAMLDNEASFNRLASDAASGRSDGAASLLGSVGGRRLRKDGFSVSSRKIPTLVEPSTTIRKNRTPV